MSTYSLEVGEKFTKEEFQERLQLSPAMVNKKISEWLNKGLIYPIPMGEDYRKFIYIFVGEPRTFEEIISTLRQYLENYIEEADSIEKSVLLWEIQHELKALYQQAKKNVESKSALILFDYLQIFDQVKSDHQRNSFFKVILQQLDNIEEIMTEQEINTLIKEIVDTGLLISMDIDFNLL